MFNAALEQQYCVYSTCVNPLAAAVILPSSELTKTIRRPGDGAFDACRSGRKVSVTTAVPLTFVSRTSLYFCRRVSVPLNCAPEIPALLMRMSRYPYLLLTCSAAVAMASSLDRSSSTGSSRLDGIDLVSASCFAAFSALRRDRAP